MGVHSETKANTPGTRYKIKFKTRTYVYYALVRAYSRSIIQGPNEAKHGADHADHTDPSREKKKNYCFVEIPQIVQINYLSLAYRGTQ